MSQINDSNNFIPISLNNTFPNRTIPFVLDSQLDTIVLIECLISIFGLVTVSINIFVFISLLNKDSIYKFLLIEAILDFSYLLGLAITTLFDCGGPCETQKHSYISQLYSLLIVDYLTSSTAINNILIEILLSLQRLFTISNRPFLQTLPFGPTTGCINVISLLYYSPVLFLKTIVSLGNNGNNFELALTDFGRSQFGKTMPIILSTVRLILVTICMFAINVTVLVKFQKHIGKKSKLLIRKSTSQCTYIYFLFINLYFEVYK